MARVARILVGVLMACLTLSAARGQQAPNGNWARARVSGVQQPALPLAAEGYCPVTLHDQRTWQRGDPRLGALFDGRQYLFAAQRQLEIFAAAPTVYAPVLSGDCIVTFAETGQRVPGRAQLGALHDGRVFFFVDADARRRFQADPARFAEADVADGGRCLVTRVDEQREVAGLPETAVLVGGLRRLFAGAHQQSLYLQNPKRYDAASAAPAPGAAAAAAHPNAAPLVSNAAAGDAATSRAGSSDSVANGDEPAIDNEPALGGYCPVAIRKRGMWVRGRYEDRVVLSKIVFFTAGPEERATFQDDPARYIPVLAGDCSVSLLDAGQKVRGSIYNAAEYQGRLFLFATPEDKATFKQAPSRYASVDVASHGECVVTLDDTGEHVPGFAEYAVWHEGLLYRFAGEEEKAKFLATPEKYAEQNENAK